MYAGHRRTKLMVDSPHCRTNKYRVLKSCNGDHLIKMVPGDIQRIELWVPSKCDFFPNSGLWLNHFYPQASPNIQICLGVPSKSEVFWNSGLWLNHFYPPASPQHSERLMWFLNFTLTPPLSCLLNRLNYFQICFDPPLAKIQIFLSDFRGNIELSSRFEANHTDKFRTLTESLLPPCLPSTFRKAYVIFKLHLDPPLVMSPELLKLF